MRTALIQLVEDFLSTIIFLAAYLLTGNLYVAVAVSMAVGIGQLILLKRRERPIDLMHWLSLGLVLAIGTATLVTNDARFIMAKPSIVHFALGIAMLRRGWLGRYLPPVVTQNVPGPVLVAAGYGWAALMIGLGALNLFVATHYSVETWAWFISVGAIGAKVVAFGLQYFVFWLPIRRNLHAAAS